MARRKFRQPSSRCPRASGQPPRASRISRATDSEKSGSAGPFISNPSDNKPSATGQGATRKPSLADQELEVNCRDEFPDPAAAWALFSSALRQEVVLGTSTVQL